MQFDLGSKTWLAAHKRYHQNESLPPQYAPLRHLGRVLGHQIKRLHRFRLHYLKIYRQEQDDLELYR